MKNLIKKKAIDFCNVNNHRLTQPRLKVLEIMISSKKPLKAYEILEKLGKTFSNPKPPTVYRAIEFWKKHNFIHRIESINAYSICDADHLHDNGTQFLICSSCGDVTESHICDLPKAIQNAINEKLFELKSWNLEMNGVCKKCN